MNPASFWSRVDKTDDCWLWRGATSRGNPHCRRNGSSIPGRKLAWIHTHGEVPDGMVVTRTCEKKLCVNPDHLEVVAKGDVPRLHKSFDYPFSEDELSEMESMYARASSCAEIAEHFGCSPALIHKRLRERGVNLRTNGFGRHHLRENTGGYLYYGHRAVHRIVAEAWYRPLLEGEHVHHIDGDKKNNHPSNLRIMDASDHHALHYAERAIDDLGRLLPYDSEEAA